MPIPPADIEVDEVLVRSLLTEQHPDLAGLPVTPLAAGWDNVSWRLGDDLVVRVPRRAMAVPLLRNEQRWLPVVAPRLPLPVPVPVRTGRPTATYPWAWSIVPWLDGTPADQADLADGRSAAVQLAAFLRALHEPAPGGAPRNPYRSIPLGDRQPTLEARLEELATQVDDGAAWAVWKQAVDAPPWAGPAMWLHGDLHPGNVLVHEAELAAVLDFGDMCAGDPAVDVAACWLLLPAPATITFAEEYDLDDDTAKRSRGWALLFALMSMAGFVDARPSFVAAGRAALDRILEGADS